MTGTGFCALAAMGHATVAATSFANSRHLMRVTSPLGP
jgi:hypothetical protein